MMNEMDYIRQTTINSLNREAHLNEVILKQAPLIRSDFIMRLMKGNVDYSQVTADDLDFIGITRNGDLYCMLVLQIEEIGIGTETTWALTRARVVNGCEVLLKDKGHVVELERNQLAVMLTFMQPVEVGEEFVSTFIGQLKQQLQNEYDIALTVAISEFHNGLHQIPECYREAMMALDYRLVKGQSSIIAYSEIKANSGDDYHYPMELEIRLFNYAKIGDYARVRETLEQIFDSALITNKTSPELYKCLSIDLLSTWFKLINHLNEQEKKGHYRRERNV